MASPQLENGYTKLANELYEQFSKLDASGSAWRVLFVVVRKTYGFHKKEDKISLTQFEESTGLTRKSVCRGIIELVSLNVVTVTKEGYINKYEIQKNYETWGSVKPDTSVQNDTKSSVKPDTKTSVQNDTYKRKKEKKDISDKSQSMKKNKLGKYTEDGHNDYENVIDLDSGEEVEDEEDKINQRVTELVLWAEGVRGKPFMDKPTQRKFIHELRKNNTHPDVIKSTYLELLGSDYWKSQKSLPDFKTVFSTLKNKK